MAKAAFGPSFFSHPDLVPSRTVDASHGDTVIETQHSTEPHSALHLDDKLLLDMHVHVGPEFLQRRYSAETLAEECRREGFGVVMKNHFQPTTGWACKVRRPDNRVALIGAVVPNFSVGGVDEHGVRAALSAWKRDVLATDPDPGPALSSLAR